MSQRLTAICHSFFGSMFVSFLVITLYGNIVMFFLAPRFVIVFSVATFLVGFTLVFSEIERSPRDSTWRSVVGAIMEVSPILVGFLNIILTPNTYIAY